MEYVLVGRTGLRVSRIGLGTAVLGLVPPESETDALIGAALDLGINLFDCANTYGNRASFDRDGLPPSAQRKHAEELLGRALRQRRDDVVLCTKVSEPVGDGVNDGGMVIPGMGGHGGGLSRFHILREVERSLKRLGTDHIDILHLHHPDPDTAIEETLRAVDDLIHAGKARYVGLSTYSGWQLTQAVMTSEHHGLARPVLDQVSYNMLSRGRSRGGTRGNRVRAGPDVLQPARRGRARRNRVDEPPVQRIQAVGRAVRLHARAKGSGGSTRGSRLGVGRQARPPGAALAAQSATRGERDHRA